MNLANNNDVVLLIESDPSAAAFIRAALEQSKDGHFAVEWVADLATGVARAGDGGIKAILLNLYLSDSQGIETLDALLAVEVGIPVLLLSSVAQEDAAKLAIQRGAQDYLLTSHIDSYSLSRAIRNVIERKNTEEALFNEKERALVTLNSMGDGVISTDTAGTITYLNIVAERMTGWDGNEAKGQPITDVLRIIDANTREPVISPVHVALQQTNIVSLNCAEIILVRRDGAESFIEDSAAPIRARTGQVIGVVIVFRDVSATRLMSLKMAHLSQHDSLTDLPNWVLLKDRLTQTISSARRHRKKFAVLHMDVDRFKYINDSKGYLIGDRLLQCIAQCMLAHVRHSDTVSRRGGDEFVILLEEVEDAQAAGHSAGKLLAALADTHCIDEHELDVTMSIGISIFPDDGDDAETLLGNADSAMYHAKEKGRNNYQFFKQEMNDRSVERQSLEGGLRQALARDEFLLHYQPKVNLETGAITGAEALIRWLHPVRGLLYPEQFVPIAEDSGLIIPIGQWIIREACRQAKTWQSTGDRPTAIAVNVSAVELRSVDFLAGIRDTLKVTGLDPWYLEIELTESVLVQDIEASIALLHALKALGLQLAIDDFGTGYSSLSYLRQFPVDTLKIDQSFVRDIMVDEGDSTIVSAVIGMGNSLKLRVTAEGVETREQLVFLQSENCEEGQGFYFSPAVDAEAFTRLRKALNSEYIVH